MGKELTVTGTLGPVLGHQWLHTKLVVWCVLQPQGGAGRVRSPRLNGQLALPNQRTPDHSETVSSEDKVNHFGGVTLGVDLWSSHVSVHMCKHPHGNTLPRAYVQSQFTRSSIH